MAIQPITGPDLHPTGCSKELILLRYLLLWTSLLLLTSCSSPPSQTRIAPQTVGTSTATTLDTRAFERQINRIRGTNNASALSYDAKLAHAAQRHANDMVRNGFFDHKGSNGSSVGQRVTAVGYTWSMVGENIAQGQSSALEALRGWTNSPGHHANNIDPKFTNFGIAKAGSGSKTTWVLVLAATQG